jgi:AcrR family transcriptional regulator
MASESGKAGRKPRADSLRNREKLLEAAATVFGAGGGQASLEAVAREAGVGIATLYRHFPTREDLFEAVYRNEVDILFALAEQLLRGEVEPVTALQRWIHASVRLFATKSGMIEALQLATQASAELKTYSLDKMTASIGMLIDRGVGAGSLRDDIGPEDVFRALVGIYYSQNQTGGPTAALRLIDVFVDGLRKR